MMSTQNEYEFTCEELKEIEKVFDMFVSQNTRQHAETMKLLAAVGGDALVKKMLEESMYAFDMHRTISAKSALMYKARMQENDKK